MVGFSSRGGKEGFRVESQPDPLFRKSCGGLDLQMRKSRGRKGTHSNALIRTHRFERRDQITLAVGFHNAWDVFKPVKCMAVGGAENEGNSALLQFACNAKG